MMNKQDINTVMNQCRVELTGVSDALLKSVMFEVLDEFFRDTSSWRETVDYTAIPDVASYDLVVEEGQIIRLDCNYDANGSFVPALMRDIPTLTLQHSLNTQQTLTAVVIKTVSLPLTSDGFPVAPDWVLQKWHLAIKHGMLGALKNQSNKSFSDGKGAVYNLAKFRQFIGNVRSAVLRANTAGASAWRFPQSFRAVSQKGGLPSIGSSNEWSG